jgi:cyclase
MNSKVEEFGEVFVVGSSKKRIEGVTTIDPVVIRKIPGANPGIENIIKTLPGVYSNNELSTSYAVRGGNYDENLVYVNEIEVYRPFLIRSGQQEGLSFTNTDMVQNVDFSAGGFQSKYGDKLSSVLDITASSDHRHTVTDLVRRVAEQVFIPFTVGGGIRTVDDFKELLREGADKISINSSAIMNPNLISEAADKFGSQCVVVAIDAKRREDGSGWNIYKNGGRVDMGIDAVEWAMKAATLGAGEILLTSMDCDGTKDGYDIELTRAISEAVSIPVIASGGAGNKEHFYDALTKGKADAALAASLFHYKELEITDLKEYLQSKDVPVRL